MKVTNICRKLAASLAAAGLLAFSIARAADLNVNLLVNPSFETLDPFNPPGTLFEYAHVVDGGWQDNTGGPIGAYAHSAGYANGTTPAGAGEYYFTFPANPTVGRQSVALSGGPSGSLIASGNAFFHASAHFANYENSAGLGDYGRLTVTFKDAGGATVGTPFVLNSSPRVLTDGTLPWTRLASDGSIPVGAATATIELIGVFASGSTSGTFREGYFDLIDFRVMNQVPVDLTLTVDRNTGNAMITTGSTGAPANITDYRITSEFGALAPGNWLSIADNYDAGSPGPNQVDPNSNWVELSGATSDSELWEEDSNANGASIASGRTINLGNAWLGNPTEDLVFSYEVDGTAHVGMVNYVGNGGQPIQSGDFNADGDITSADWLILRGSRFTDLSGLSGAEAYRRGDITEDLAVTHADFAAFKQAYEQSNGIGSFEAMLASVPEPSSLALVIVVGMLGLLVRRGR